MRVYEYLFVLVFCFKYEQLQKDPSIVLTKNGAIYDVKFFFVFCCTTSLNHMPHGMNYTVRNIVGRAGGWGERERVEI